MPVDPGREVRCPPGTLHAHDGIRWPSLTVMRIERLNQAVATEFVEQTDAWPAHAIADGEAHCVRFAAPDRADEERVPVLDY